MSQPKIKVVVCVRGGVVESVCTDSPSLVDAIVVDFDDAKEEGLDDQGAMEAKKFADGSTASSVDCAGNWIW